MATEQKPDRQSSEEKPNEEITKVLEEIKTAAENLKKPAEPVKEVPRGPSPQDRRAELQKKLGFNDDQMQAHEQSIREAAAPAIESQAWARLEKKSDIEVLRKDIEAEVAAYPMERRTPELLEKIYYYARGKHAESKPKEEPKKGPVVQTRVSGGPGYDGSNPGMSGGREEASEVSEELDDREKFVAQKLGVTEKDYAKARNVGRTIRDLRPEDNRPVTSLADIELRRMVKR